MRLSVVTLLTVLLLVAQAPVPRLKRKGPPPYDLAKAKACWSLLDQHERIRAMQCFGGLLNEKDPALKAEGHWGMGQFKEALAEYDLAVQIHPEDARLLTRRGQLFWARFNKTEAFKDLKAAQDLDPTNAEAMLFLAEMMSRGFDSKAVDLAKKAAEADPSLYQAHELLAQMALENSDEKEAVEQANKALAVNAKSLKAKATLGAIELLKNKPTDQFAQIAAINPKYGEGWFWAGHYFILNRRYEEAIELFRKGIAMDPDLLRAREQLGVNLMRIGKPDEAREQLQYAYDRGYHSEEVVNSLRLMDSYKNFISFKFEGGEVRLHKKEADVLSAYFEDEVRKARATYESKYKMNLKANLEVEVYPDHEDFAVRTLGVPGLGATGVSFGPVVAMDSPSARKAGDYHWASTLWHELSHSYILVKSKFLVPRWFTEGISVHEETQASPEWGDPVEPPILMAIQQKQLLPVEELDGGFVRPKNPLQIGISYFQAGQALDLIARDFGQATINAMVDSFAARETTGEVIRKHLKMEPKEFDQKLLDFINTRYGKAAERMGEWRTAMGEAAKAVKSKDWDAAILAAEKARQANPFHVSDGSAYEALGDAYLAKNNKEKAKEVLREYGKRGGRDPETLKKLAKLEDEAGDPAMAAQALQRLIYVSPVGDEDLHRKLGEYYLMLKQPQRALPAFRAQLASKPVDPAGAYYNLAKTLMALSKRQEAQDALFQSLEVAPGYKPAQKLLLELNKD
jgi:tetratricopeptide (TPR) repeat protein